MKAQSLTIKNIGLITEETIEINLPLILFFGDIKQGKTTILNCFKWVCGGAFPDDIIQHGKDEGAIDFGFDNAIISRSFYRSKPDAEGKTTTKARDIVFIRDGKPVGNPVSEIKRLLNPFLLDQDYLKKMGDTDRKRWFGEFFAVDTSALDQERVVLDREATQLRATIKGYGEISLVKAEPVDVEPLKKELAAIRSSYSDRMVEHRAKQEAGSKRIADRTRGTEQLSEIEDQIKALEAKRNTITTWMNQNPVLPISPLPPPPETSALEERISGAAAQNVRAEQFQKDKQRADAKATDQKKLSEKEARMRQIKADKIAKLEGITKDCKIKGLSFDDEGNFRYEDTDSGMLSTSQIIKLSSELSSLYPEGFGLELLDRAESLGKSIFEFIERAKAQDLSILATVVGEAPAKVPDHVGVFVVEKGKIKGAKKPKSIANTNEATDVPLQGEK